MGCFLGYYFDRHQIGRFGVLGRHGILAQMLQNIVLLINNAAARP
jgi:hypothetical protein